MPDEYKLVNASSLERSLQYEADQLRAKLGTEEGITFDMENERAFGDAVRNIPSGSSGSDVFVCTYNVTTSAEIEEAYQSGKQVILKFNGYVMPLARRESATYHNFSVVWLGHSTYNLAIAYFFVCENDRWRSYSQTLPAITSLAAPFSTIIDYFTGDYVSYNKNLYRFIADHPRGAWNDAHVVSVPIANDVSALAKSLNGKANATSVSTSASIDNNGLISFKNADNTQLFTVQLPLYAGGVD